MQGATDSFARILERSAAFFEHLGSLAQCFGDIAETERAQATADACDLSLDHATSLQILFSAGAAASACVLLRAQYEALLRAAWLLYSAEDAQFERLMKELGPQSEQAARNLPGAKKMLQDLERANEENPGLTGLVTPLRQIRDVSWTAMNSFVHAGIHPLSRSGTGFPAELAEQVIRNSNGMVHLAVRLLHRASEQPAVAHTDVDRSYLGFEDCLPMVTQAS